MNVEQILTNAQKALLYEVTTNPKPGLVDPVEHGAHPDMDIYTFIDSSEAMRSYLEQCCHLATASRPPSNFIYSKGCCFWGLLGPWFAVQPDDCAG